MIQKSQFWNVIKKTKYLTQKEPSYLHGSIITCRMWAGIRVHQWMVVEEAVTISTSLMFPKNLDMVSKK